MAGNEIKMPGVTITPIDGVQESADLPRMARLSSASRIAKKNSSGAYKDPELSRVKATVMAGENDFRQVGRVEVKAFDSSFLSALETGLDAIGRILANPRTFIKETTELENVEKAKKVSTISIQHFATHSQYLRSVEDNGEVIPDKILTIHSETNTAIYENRFVMTLIKRALQFVEQRYSFVRDHGETRDSDELFVHSVSDFSGVKYEMSMRVRASVPSLDAGESEKNAALLRRLAVCKKICADYLRSSFMTQMKGAKDVTSPIHMTNMLLKHPDYHAAYELWEFIDAYDKLGVSYDVMETAKDFDKEYLSSLYEVIAEAILKFNTRHVGIAAARDDLNHAKRVTPNILFSIDDLNYEDGKFLYDAYPEAEKAVDPTSLILEEERKAALDKKMLHLNAEEQGRDKLVRNVKKDKDKVAFAAARGRDEKKAVLEDAEKQKKQEKEKRLALEEAKKEAKRQADLKKKKEEEAKAYEDLKASLGGGL